MTRMPTSRTHFTPQHGHAACGSWASRCPRTGTRSALRRGRSAPGEGESRRDIRRRVTHTAVGDAVRSRPEEVARQSSRGRVIGRVVELGVGATGSADIVEHGIEIGQVLAHLEAGLEDADLRELGAPVVCGLGMGGLDRDRRKVVRPAHRCCRIFGRTSRQVGYGPSKRCTRSRSSHRMPCKKANPVESLLVWDLGFTHRRRRQFSSFRPSTRRNSRTLSLTSTRSKDSACAAIWRS